MTGEALIVAARRTPVAPRGGYPIDNQATVAPWLVAVSEPAIRDPRIDRQ